MTLRHVFLLRRRVFARVDAVDLIAVTTHNCKHTMANMDENKKLAHLLYYSMVIHNSVAVLHPSLPSNGDIGG